MYTIEEIRVFREKSKRLALHGCNSPDKYTDEELQVICNGIGPAILPDVFRKAVNNVHPTLECAAFLHDIAVEESDGTRGGFTVANDDFKENGYLLAKDRYPWYHPCRYLVMNNARRLANYCQQGGWLLRHPGE